MIIAAILGERPPEVARIGPEESVADAAAQLASRRVGALLVMTDGHIEGVISERDVVRAVATTGAGALDLKVRLVMTAPVVTIAPGDSIAMAMGLMTDRRIRHLPVVEHGVLKGIVSIGDLVKHRIEEAEQEALALKDYIATG
jgi:CBS domain-containing protein